MPPIDGLSVLRAPVARTPATDPFARLIQIAPAFGLKPSEVSLPRVQASVAEMQSTHRGFETLGAVHSGMVARIASDETIDLLEALPALEALATGLTEGRIYRVVPPDTRLREVIGEAPVGPDASRLFRAQVTVAQKIAQRLLQSKTIDDAIQVVLEEYPEMKWLTGEVHATPEGGGAASSGGFVSERLFAGKRHIELDRTAVGIMTFLWVLKGDYKSFTACQGGRSKLTEESFMQLQAYTRRILQSNPEALDALIVYTLAFDALTAYTVVNDLGKVVKMVDYLVAQAGLDSVDHDKILYDLLSRHPQVSPSFHRLPERYRGLILNGLKAVFNMGQFMQAENVPASLSGLIGLDKESLDFYMLHFVYDLAGAAGQVRQDGSIVLTEDTFRAFQAATTALDGLNTGETLDAVYDTYLKLRADALGLDVQDATDRVVARVACMFRIFDPTEAAVVKEAFLDLPRNARAILENELQKNGTEDGFAILPYYGPALLVNLRGALTKIGEPDPLRRATSIGLLALARVYQLGRIALKGRAGNGVYIVNLANLARVAQATPLDLNKVGVSLRPVGQDAEAEADARSVIGSAPFEKIDSLASLPGQRIVVIGIGGGSDGVQAAMLGKVLQQAGKAVPAVISVRTEKTDSQGPGGAMGERRTITNHGGEVVPGVYRVRPESEGSGRFLEFLPARDFPTYLAVDPGDDSLTARIQAILDEVKDVDTVIAVDTGGDALFSVSGQDQARATPDQDLRVLRALRGIREKVLTAEVAPGIDSPDHSQAILQRADARVYSLSAGDRETVLATYAAWEMTGENPGRFGKTALAWQRALRDEFGLQVLPLPTNVVLDPGNPWNPFVPIDPSMADIFFMPLAGHLQAIA